MANTTGEHWFNKIPVNIVYQSAVAVLTLAMAFGGYRVITKMTARDVTENRFAIAKLEDKVHETERRGMLTEKDVAVIKETTENIRAEQKIMRDDIREILRRVK